MKEISSSVNYERVLEMRSAKLSRTQRQLIRDLVAMRKKHKLSQDEVAARMGISQPAVSTFERFDSNPTFATIRRYAFAVEADLEFQVKDVCLNEGGWTPAARASVEVQTPRQTRLTSGDWERSRDVIVTR